MYEKSAELGNSKAMMALGRIHEQGIGTKVDMVKATTYYDAAAAKNEPYAFYWLGKQCEVSLSFLTPYIDWTAS
jgi:enhanced entry protein EnhC